MIIKRKKGESIYNSQLDRHGGLVYIKDGKLLKDELEKREANSKLRTLGRPTEKGTIVSMAKKGYLSICRYRGKEKTGGRWIYNELLSNKSPKEAYRDFLRSEEIRQAMSDIVDSDKYRESNKQIKDEIRKVVRKRNIRRGLIAGTIAAGATAGTIAGVKAIKKKKSKKEDK